MRFLIAFGLATMFAGCATVPAPQSETAVQGVDQKYVGKKMWVSNEYSEPKLCPQTGYPTITTGCTRVKSGSSLVVDGVVREPDKVVGRYLSDPFYHVKVDGGPEGFIEFYAMQLLHTDDLHRTELAADADCKRRGQPRIGMTAAQVTGTCVGKPLHVNRTQTAGHTLDQYVYDNDRYLYLTDGVLTSMQSSGQLR